ncbi:MAG: metal ABC transporter permease [Schleiferiaceae bacterium]
MDAFWIIITGFLVASSTGMLGNLLLLRKMSMMGDALSHAVLPGIVVAYLISGSRASIPLFAGAIIMGVLTTFLIQFFSSKGKMQSDAAMGTVFTFLFAVGVILVTKFAGEADIDADCVLHGELAFVPLQTSSFLGLGVPAPVWTLLGLLAVIQIIFWTGYKGWLITSFNPEYAQSVGIRTVLWHYSLMAATSVATVVSFESVGAILVIAFLVVPAATAYLLTDKLPLMTVIILIHGLISSTLGYFVSDALEASISGSIAVMSFVLFAGAFLWNKKKG